MKKLFLPVLVTILLFTGTGCNKKSSAPVKKKVAPTDSLSVCIASEPDTIDPALNSTADGATLITHLFSGLAKWSQDEKGNNIIVADSVETLTDGIINADGTVTYTYKLKEGLRWSNGDKLTASDFVFSWNRAASPGLSADYSNLFAVIKGYDEMWASDKDGNLLTPDAKLAVEAKDDRTLTVTLKNYIGYWNELLAFPVFFPVHEKAVTDDSWATKASTYICNGPYILDSWVHKSVIILRKNDGYHNKADVTMPELKFYLSDNETNMITNYKTGDWLMIDNVPVAEIQSLKQAYADEFYAGTQLGTYYICWNINEDILPEGHNLSEARAEKARAEIRSAISLLIERNYIAAYISQGGEFPASSFVARGLTDYDGISQFYENAGNNDNFNGYYDISSDAYTANCIAAEETLKKYYSYDEKTGKLTDFPKIEYIYNTDVNHQKIAEYVYNVLKLYGINITLRNEEWNTFVNTRKNGNFTIARNGWIADFNDPLSFLELWISSSGNNDIQFGKGRHGTIKAYGIDLTPYGIELIVENGTWAETYDVLIEQIKACTDSSTRYALMHYAEDMLMSTGCITPIYYYSDIYMLDSRVEGFFTNPLGYKFFMHTTVNQK